MINNVNEIKYTFIISFILIVLGYYFECIPMDIDFTTFLSVSSALFGFLITTLSILLVFPDEGRIKILKKHESYGDVFTIFLLSICFQIIVFLISLFGNLYNIQNFNFNLIFSWALLVSLLLIILDLWIIKNMIKILLNN